MKKILVSIVIITGLILLTQAAETKVVLDDIKLPAPAKTGGMSLMEALNNRHSSAKFSKNAIPLEKISGLLWAANGKNRPDGKRTTPSALNAQIITLYVVLPDGIFKYNPVSHTLEAYSKENIGTIVGSKAPLIILYVANLTRQSKYLAAVDCGFIGQNIYLYSAANNLGTTFLYGVNTSALNYKLELKLGEEVLFAQVVGSNN